MGTIGTGTELLDAEYARIGGIDGSDRTYSARLWTQTLRATVAADMTGVGGGTVALGQPKFPTSPFGGAAVSGRFRIVGGRVIFPAPLIASDTNNATLTVNWYPPTGTTATAALTITTSTTGTGTVNLGQVVALTLTAANAGMVADGTLVLSVTKGGTGVTLNAGTTVEVDVVAV